MATNKGYSIRNFEEWKNGGQNGGSSQTTANSNTFGEPQHTTSNKYSVQSFEEWRQNRTSGVTPGGDSAIMDWMDRYNRVMQGVSIYDKKRNGGFTQDASGGFGSEIDSLIADYDGIEGYASEYGFRDAQKYLVQLKKLQNSIGKINDSFSQFEDEDDYNRYMEYWRDQEEKKNLDLDAYSREIAQLEQQLEDYDPQIDWTDTNQRKQYDKGLQELEDEINRRKQYLAQAQRIQKKDNLSAVANPESEKYDAAFDSKSGYVSTEQDGKLQRMMSQYSMGYDDLTYEYINNQNGIRDTIKQKAGAYKKGETPFEAKGYDYMTEDEVGLYNYYYSMGGKDSAEAYLDTIQKDLLDRKATGIYEPIKGKTGAELVFGVEAGLDQFKSGIKGAVRAVKGDDSYVSPSAIQIASQMVREDLADDGAKLPSWLGGASLGQVGYDTITTSANMAPSILGSVAANFVLPGSGAAVGSALLGGSAAGNAYQEALNEGYTVDQARGYGILSGASEIIMERLLGGISAYGGNALGKFFTQNMKNADTALKRIAKEIGSSMLSEFSEEYLQEVLTPVFQNLTLGTDNEVKLVSAEALYAGFLGAITGGIMEGPQVIANARNATQLASNSTPEPSKATETEEKSTPLPGNATVDKESAVTEDSSAADSKMSATESTVTKSSGKNESSPVKVGVSKMETVQQTADIESFAQQFGTQANEVRRNYLEGQLKHEPENLQEYQVGFMAAYTIGWNGGKVESLSKHVPYLSQSQREIAFSLGRDAAAAQKAAETKAATAKAPTTKASMGQTAQLVAEDGSNGGTVTIAEIVSMDNSGMTLRLEDGRTVTDEDLDFQEGAEVYSTVMELGMDAESANAIVKASAAASIPRAAVAEGIETAYHYGRYGYGMDALLKAKEAAEIPESILQASYQAGEKRRQQHRETAQAEENRATSKATAQDRRGKVHFHGESDALNDVQKESLRGLEWIADLTGAQIHVEDMGDSEGLSRVNGLYDPADDSIHIDLRAGSDGTGTLLYTAAHEFVHRMRRNNEAAFYRLADFLVEQYGKKGISTDALVKQQMADAAADGIELNYDEAFEEMVADAMEAMFTDTDALAKMEKLKTQDKSLWQEIKDFVLGLAEKIKSAYARLKPDSAEGRYVLQMKDSIDRIAQLFAEGVMETGAEKSTAESSGVKYQARHGGKITMHMTDTERAEILKNKAITAEIYEGQADETIRSEKENLTSYRDNLVKAALVKIGEEFGVFTDYSIADVDVDICLSRSNLKESISKKIDPTTIAKLLPTLKTAVENAVGIECHANRYFYDNDTVMFENLLGGYVDGEKFIPIRFGLKHSVTGKATLYLIVDQEGIDVKKIKAEVTKATAVQFNDRPKTSRSAFNISVASVVPFVNKKDMLRYLPDDMLNNQQKKAKYEAIAETIDYTNDKNDRKYAEYIRDGKLSSAKQMVEATARAAGYAGLYYHGAKKGGGFTKFRDWAYFTQNKGYAERYTQRGNPDSLYAAFVKMEKPFDTRNADAEELFAEIHDEYGLGEIQDSGLPDWTDGYDIADYIDENELGYDSIVLDEGGDLVNGKPVSRGLSYVIRKSEQIKSAEVITYDDNGNIIPISKRFDSSNPDIRYSRRKKTETEALREQYEKLQEDVDRLKELLKLQGKVTHGKIMKPSSVEAAAKYLKKLFHTDGDTKELAQKLNEFYEYLVAAPELDDFGEYKATAPELILESVKEQAAPIVEWLQEHEKFQRNQYAQEILDTLKGQSFYLDETQLGEAKSQYGSITNYRRVVKNMVTGKSTQSLDQLWQVLSGQYPDIFSPDTNASDMPLAFADALDRLENMEDTETAADWMMKDQIMFEEILDSFWRVDRLETVADRYKKQINELRWKHELQMKQLRRDRDAVLANLRADKNLSVKIVRDNQDRAELRRKIQKHAKAMSQKLLKPSDNAHVPEELRHTVAQVLNAINMESQYTLDPETGKRKKAPDGLPVERTKAFLKLQQQCNAIMENGGNIIIDPEMADKLTDVLGWSDTPMAEMTKEQLETVWKVIRSVEHSISTAGKMLTKARWESVDGFAGALEQTAQSRGNRKQLTDRNIGLDMETPITFFSHFGEAGEEMFRMLRDAQDKEQVLQDLMGAEARKLTTAKQIEQLESQVHQFTVDGQTLYLNTAQIMELYVLTKQEDARNHLLSENNGKGIVQPNIEGQQDAGGKKKKVKVREGEQAVRMNAGELGTIIGSLTEEQRALADGLQKLTDLLAAEGNKASMQVYGYQKFTGKDYWPIRSSSLQLKEGVDKRLTPKRSVKNMSSAKNRQENAKNALTVPGIFDTFSRHCKEMTEYAAYLAVMEDLDRLYNYQYSEKTTNEQGEEVWKLTNKAAKGYLKQLAGTGADRYWMNLMEDLQNGIGSNSVWGYGTVGKAKAAAVSGNIRVILQQFTAFPRAAVCMKTSDLLYGMTHSKGAWKRALQHSPTAMRKDAGTFDIGNAKQMKELLFDIHSSLDKANDALAKGAGWADAVTWGWLWRAAEHQATKKLEIGTDAYWQEVNRIFTQVIDESQVIDGILQRSKYMRNPDGISKMQTAFMGEPTMALNLVLRSYDSWAYETDENKRTEARKRLARAASGVVLANVLAAIAQSIPDAWRDDDEDKTYWERFAKALTGYDPEAEGWQQVKGIVLEGNLVSSLNPLGWIPWIKDVLSLIQGFDVSRADTDLIKDLVKAATNITNKDSTKTTAYRVKELAEVGVKLLGNGMSNILRDVYGFTHSVMVDAQNAAGLYTINALVHEPMTNKGRYMNLLYRAIGWGDTGGYEYVKQQLLTDGYTDGDIRDAMKERIKADYKEGAIDRDTAFDRLVKYASDPELDAEEAKNELWFQLEAIDGKAAYQAGNGNAEGYSYSRYDKVYAAIRGNGNFQEAVKELTDHGYEKETVIGEVKSRIGQWQRDGEITETEAQKMLTTYGEMAAADAKARTEAWAWMKNNPKSEATVEQVEAYQRPLEGLNRSIENLGIDMDIYLKEKKTVDAFKSDKDEYGKSIAYSRINKAFPYINQLNLTRDQKTALAVACGWSYKTVNENKLW